MPASLLALAASACWGTSDFLAGFESRRSSVWAAALVGQVVAALGSLALAAAVAPEAPGAGTFAVLVAGGLSSAVGVIAGYRALVLTKMSVAAPIFAGAAVVPVLWGVAGGDRPGPVQWVGVAAALIGIAWISRGSSGTAGGPQAVSRSGVAFAVVTALGMGGMLVALDGGATGDPYWPVTIVRCSAALAIAAFVALARPRLSMRRAAAPVLVVVGLLILVANAAFAAASSMADLSVVAVLGWLGPAVIVFWARVRLREHLRPAQWAAAGLILVGVVCLAGF